MNIDQDIYQYYNEIAPNYDENRFGNTYGRYLHEQEDKFLEKHIHRTGNILDLGCGTGRHLKYATHGLDLSENMIAQSKIKFPEKELVVGSAFKTAFSNVQFNQAFTFHVLMHLANGEIQQAIYEAERILKPGGQFIFDIPSRKRRKLINYQPNDWHGAASLSIAEIKKMTHQHWNIKIIQGVLFMPIHRFPKSIRKLLLPLDNLFCKSFLKEYASYLMVLLEKK